MRQQMYCVVVALLIGMAAWSAPTSTRAASNYYVAVDGSDTNPGSFEAPFATIQQCAAVAQAGDTCLIRAGTYRELVTPANSGSAGSPITFRPYQNEVVTISGADRLSGWTKQSGAVYQTSMPWTMKDAAGDPTNGALPVDDQIWVDGQLQIPARWPNISLSKATNFGRNDLAIAEGASKLSASTAIYTDTALTQFPPSYWNGAKINLAPGLMWVNQTCNVTSSTILQIAINCPAGSVNFNEAAYTPRAQNHYFLWGVLAALDSPGEWYRSTGGSLSIWMPNSDNPANHVVEAKRRLYAFDLRGHSFITISGLRIVGASIQFDRASSDILLSELDLQHIWGFSEFPANPRDAEFKGALNLIGSRITLRDSSIGQTAAGPIFIGGTGNRVINNVIADLAYMGSGHAISGEKNPSAPTNNLLEQNTIYNSGAHAVTMAPYLTIRANDISFSHALITDMGTLYAWGMDGKGAEIAYNYVHNNQAIRSGNGGPDGFFGGSTIYFDFATSNYVVHHNVTWNASKAGILVFAYDHDATAMLANPNQTAQNILLYNNTVDGEIYLDIKAGTHMTGTTVLNNLYGRFNSGAPPASVTYNASLNRAFGNSDPGFVNRAARDYRLNGTISGISDAGQPIAPYTDGFSGSAPDLGAFEGGVSTPVVGATLRQRDLAQLSAICTSGSSVSCTISNLPVGRTLPSTFRARIGSAEPSSCTATTDDSTHITTATCSNLSISGLSGIQPFVVQIGEGETATLANITIGGSTVWLPLVGN
ncbi:MAG: carbohydrate-binding protein [Roseiflexaceae bacterium]